jgi:hypothetical protein
MSTGFIMTRKDMVIQGELLPPGIFTDYDIKGWLREGRIELAGVTMEVAEEAERVRVASKFRCDPSILVGKSMEDLTIMVLEIDPDFNTDNLADEQAAVQLLTSDWQPSMRQTMAPVNDRSRPQALALDKLEQVAGGSALHTGNTEMSSEAAAGLEAAKARANAPQSEE